MSIAALITEGIGPGGSVLYALTGGLNIGVVLNPWSPVAAGSDIWNVTTANADIWTPVTPGSTPWTPE